MAQIATERAERAAATGANPAPLGLAAFALTTFVLSVVNAGFLASTTTGIVIGLALFYGGLGQIIAGVNEFRAGNTFGATAFCSYGGFWLSFAVILLVPSALAGAKAADVEAALGFYLLGWAIFTGYMFLGTLRSNLALMGVFFFLTLTFLALAIAHFSGSPGVSGSTAQTFNVIGGYLGIVTALFAWYTSFAGVLASGPATFKLPVGPRS